MRPASARQDTPEKPKGESMDDRDNRLESYYSYDRQGERSTMAYVSTYAAELAEAFFAWREIEYQLSRTTGEGIADGLRRWEAGRFGAQLDAGPHGILWFRVRCLLAHEHGGRKLSPGYFDRTPAPARAIPGSVETAADKLSRGMKMPHGPSRAQHERRVAELEAQRDENNA